MPSWSPDDAEIAFVSTRGNQQAVWAVTLENGAERRISATQARADAPSWGPGGQIVYHVTEGQAARLETGGRPLTGAENAFPFRASWMSPTEFVYTSDGKIRKRALVGGEAQTVEFKATLPVAPARYARKKRGFDSEAKRRALGIVRPVLSPDGTRVAFAAIGALYVMPIGGKPRNLTQDAFLDTDPAWSPDGQRIAYSSDRGGKGLQLWVRELGTGHERQLTRLETQPMAASWSPDGTRIAFLEGRRDVASSERVGGRRGERSCFTDP
jgi:Tol biopolymer transport system component